MPISFFFLLSSFSLVSFWLGMNEDVLFVCLFLICFSLFTGAGYFTVRMRPASLVGAECKRSVKMLPRAPF